MSQTRTLESSEADTRLTTDVPDTDTGVERGGHNEVLRGVEARAHDVVVVAGEDGHALPRLPVPQADGLVVRRRQDPGVVLRQGLYRFKYNGCILRCGNKCFKCCTTVIFFSGTL